MKVVSWNLGAAYGRWRDDPELHDRAWRWLAECDPDLALLQETQPPRWAGDEWTVVHGEYQRFASAIVARRELELTPVELEHGSTLERFGAYLATAGLRLPKAPALMIASVHTSAKMAPDWGHPGFERSAIGRRTVGEPWWNDVAFAGYERLVGDRPFLIGGDWNTARYVDDDGVASPEGSEFFERAAAAGWVDISLDASKREGKSWYGSTNPRRYQPDHVFADTTTAKLVRAFTIDPTPAMFGLSDHAPLVLDISLAKDAA
jgi:exonuclease III